jgi:hypothetical protein
VDELSERTGALRRSLAEPQPGIGLRQHRARLVGAGVVAHEDHA